MNVPNAMEPEDVIRSINVGPYTVRTVFGWTVNGPLRRGNCNHTETTHEVTQATSNRISVAKLDELWNQLLKYDFPEDSQVL